MRASLIFSALAAASLAACATPGPAPVASAQPAAVAEPACAAGGVRMNRLELIFGLDIKGGGRITEKDWYSFLETEVTPRFPDGLTTFDGYGQWKVPGDGRIARLKTKLLLIWYAPSEQAENAIQAVREAYKTKFNQISVMRIDGQDCVSF
jgi:hypothetical protein